MESGALYSLVDLVVMVIMVIISALSGRLIFKMKKLKKFNQRVREQENKKSWSQKLEESMIKTKVSMFNYSNIERFITSYGLVYMSRGKLTPISYIFVKFAFALLGGLIGLSFDSYIAALLMTIGGFLAIDIIARLSDSSDNNAMLDDIKTIYDTLRIQTKAGVYITSVLIDCYLSVQNKRLKKALLELTSDIASKNELADSLEVFRGKFNNQYIDTLAIVIKQSLITGQASKMFEDIREQINDIENALIVVEEQRIKNSILLVQLFMYISIILCVIFVLITTISDGLLF